MIRRKFGSTGVDVPVIGQGTWQAGGSPEAERLAIAALRAGIDLGLTHIDTAEVYGNGRVEELVSEAIAGRRDEVFLVSKVWPANASFEGTQRSCEQSLKRLKTDRLDLYLLHWPSRHPIRETMRAMEALVASGKVRFIGVSNFTLRQMREAQQALGRESLVCNQVRHHLDSRRLELRLLPYCSGQGIAIVGFSPFQGGNFPSPASKGGRVLSGIARQHGRTPRQVVLNFLTRNPAVFAIPKASTIEHVRENAEATGWQLSADEMEAIGRAFPIRGPLRPLVQKGVRRLARLFR